MSELILYVLAVAYLTLIAFTVVMLLLLAFLWIRYGFYLLFPKQVTRWRMRHKETLIDKFLRRFDE